LVRLITVRRAKEEIQRLQHYVNLAESYETKTLEKLIIKEYAITNSMLEVTRNLTRRGYLKNNEPIDKEYVPRVINDTPADELQRILKSGYLKRTKHTFHT
jgi:hypothetical protein